MLKAARASLSAVQTLDDTIPPNKFLLVDCRKTLDCQGQYLCLQLVDVESEDALDDPKTYKDIARQHMYITVSHIWHAPATRYSDQVIQLPDRDGHPCNIDVEVLRTLCYVAQSYEVNHLWIEEPCFWSQARNKTLARGRAISRISHVFENASACLVMPHGLDVFFGWSSRPSADEFSHYLHNTWAWLHLGAVRKAKQEPLILLEGQCDVSASLLTVPEKSLWITENSWKCLREEGVTPWSLMEDGMLIHAFSLHKFLYTTLRRYPHELPHQIFGELWKSCHVYDPASSVSRIQRLRTVEYYRVAALLRSFWPELYPRRSPLDEAGAVLETDAPCDAPISSWQARCRGLGLTSCPNKDDIPSIYEQVLELEPLADGRSPSASRYWDLAEQMSRKFPSESDQYWTNIFWLGLSGELPPDHECILFPDRSEQYDPYTGYLLSVWGTYRTYLYPHLQDVNVYDLHAVWLRGKKVASGHLDRQSGVLKLRAHARRLYSGTRGSPGICTHHAQLRLSVTTVRGQEWYFYPSIDDANFLRHGGRSAWIALLEDIALPSKTRPPAGVQYAWLLESENDDPELLKDQSQPVVCVAGMVELTRRTSVHAELWTEEEDERRKEFKVKLTSCRGLSETLHSRKS